MIYHKIDVAAARRGIDYVPWNYAPNARSRGSILRQAGKPKGTAEYCVKAPPLASLPLNVNAPLISAVPIDTLHMRMRIGGKLMMQSASLSVSFTRDKLASGLQAIVRKTSVPFRFYEANVRGKTQLKHNNLTGSQWKRMLQSLGAEIRASRGVFSEEIKETLASLWEEFNAVLTLAGKCEKEAFEEIAWRAREWSKLYASIGFNVTPYVHFFGIHLAMCVRIHGGLDRLSGELVELANDSIKRTHHRRTNQRDPHLTLQTQLRVELQGRNRQLKQAQEGESQKRKARQQHPWQARGMKEHLSKKRQMEEAERQAETSAQRGPYVDLTVQQLKEQISARTGERTRKTKRDSLLAVLRNLDEPSDYDVDGACV